jgi:hypothetical protein
VQAVENYDDASLTRSHLKFENFSPRYYAQRRSMEDSNALGLKTSGVWLEPKDGSSARFPLELSIELRREKRFTSS